MQGRIQRVWGGVGAWGSVSTCPRPPPFLPTNHHHKHVWLKILFPREISGKFGDIYPKYSHPLLYNFYFSFDTGTV